ncbi:hypothetical protein EW145_g2783 [Phellinidium pouzarii]|uniref:PWWP domain-containing protein n=1 Tax=Phellinidium pouzarii TaxID=167371 RepID=A0A4S4L9R5_9AGAM|nr:hypothetical protein EW145_g2783 [Phellinidium pouzarii]
MDIKDYNLTIKLGSLLSLPSKFIHRLRRIDDMLNHDLDAHPTAALAMTTAAQGSRTHVARPPPAPDSISYELVAMPGAFAFLTSGSILGTSVESYSAYCCPFSSLYGLQDYSKPSLYLSRDILHDISHQLVVNLSNIFPSSQMEWFQAVGQWAGQKEMSEICWSTFGAICLTLVVGALTRGLEGANSNNASPFNLFGYSMLLHIYSVPITHANRGPPSRPDKNVLLALIFPLLQLSMIHALGVKRRWSQYRLVPTSICSLATLIHFNVALLTKPATYPLLNYLPCLLETTLLFITLLTISLNVLTQLLLEGHVNQPLFGHARTLAPKWDEDFAIVLLRIGTASLEATSVAGLGNEVGPIAVGDSRELSLQAGGKGKADGGVVELTSAGVLSVIPSKTKGNSRRSEGGFANEIKSVKVKMDEDGWLIDHGWIRELMRFGLSLLGVLRGFYRVVLWAVWYKWRGVALSRRFASEEVLTNPPAQLRQIIRVGPSGLDEHGDPVYGRFLRGENISDDEDEYIPPHEPVSDGSLDFTIRTSDEEDELEAEAEDSDSGSGLETADLYADILTASASSSSVSSGPVLLAHMTAASPWPLTRRRYNQLVSRPLKQVSPHAEADSKGDEWTEFIRNRRVQVAASDSENKSLEGRMNCVICTAEPREVICWPCRERNNVSLLALSEQARRPPSMLSKAQKTRLPRKMLPKRGVAANAAVVFAEQLASSSPVPENEPAGSGVVGMGALSDLSELSSLADEDEVQDKGKGKASTPSEGGDDDSDSDSNGDHNGPFTPRKNALKVSVIRPQHSLSKIGIGIARPVQATGIRTYGGRKRGPRLDLKLPRTPKTSTSPHLLITGSSPLTPLSPTPLKKRASASARHFSSSPSKRKIRGDEDVSNDHPPALKGPPPKRRMTINGFISELQKNQGVVTDTKGKHRQEDQSSASVSFLSEQRSRRDSVLERPGVWSLNSLGTLAWVRVNRENTPTDDLRKEAFWWPAKIEQVDEQAESVQTRLYFPPAPDSPDFLQLEIKNPSPGSILSQVNTQRHERFNFNTFYSLPSNDLRSVEYDRIGLRWQKAYKLMLSDDIDMNDGLPSSIAGLLSQVPKGSDIEGKQEYSAKARKGDTLEDALGSDLLGKEKWSPPPPDVHIQIPGELVLAKEKRSKRYFWPAKVIGYVPPDNFKARAKYLVKFLDNTEFEISRDMFYIYEQEEFGTCQLGKFDSVESLHDKDGEDDLNQEFLSKASGPFLVHEPTLPAPPPEEFCELPMLEQSAYIFPILTDILKNTYKPAEQRNLHFFKGGRQRVMLSESVHPKGTLTPQEYDTLGYIVRRWGLGCGSLQIEDLLCSSSNSKPVENVPVSTLDVPKRDQGTVSHQDDPNGSSPIAIYSHIHSEDCSPSSLPPSSLPPSSSLPSTIDDLSRDIPKSDIDDNPETVDGNISTKPVRVSIATDDRSTPSMPAPFFNDLSEHEKINYCTEVLLGEAVIQLLLWRSGKRHDVHPLTDSEEERLHESGLVMANDFDFVHSILALREKREKSIRAKQPLKPQNSAKGTRSRPR